MTKVLFFLFLFAMHTGLAQIGPSPVSVIPQPVHIAAGEGQFLISPETVLVAKDSADQNAANFLNDYLQKGYGFTLPLSHNESENSIRIVTRPLIQAPEKEAYHLVVKKESITIEGDSYAGSFYGIQTLIQLLPPMPDIVASTLLPVAAVDIYDYPRFAYRGMHLDVARHFFGPEYIKRYLDYLAFHKLNYFHWHLTDDQGWRIEIKAYPALTSTAAYRQGTVVGRGRGSGNDNLRYGGFYTQNEVREVVKYAAERHITVIPEIEMPGHSSAAIAAYPWLSCFPEKETPNRKHTSEASKRIKGKKVQESGGVFRDILCAGKESSFEFLQQVLDEVLDLFPSPYIHIGGDEVPKEHWRKCPHCQARIKNEGLKNEAELQSYFCQRIEKYLNKKGRTIIGWDEILEGGLAPNAMVMSWRGDKGGIAAAKQGHSVIMTPDKPLYFDHSPIKKEDSVTVGGYNPLRAVYHYEPVPKKLATEEAKHILGAQANLWTEYIGTPSKLEYMLLPRLSALSEVLWTPKNQKNWFGFQERLPLQFQRYDLWKANYSKAFLGDKKKKSTSP